MSLLISLISGEIIPSPAFHPVLSAKPLYSHLGSWSQSRVPLRILSFKSSLTRWERECCFLRVYEELNYHRIYYWYAFVSYDERPDSPTVSLWLCLSVFRSVYLSVFTHVSVYIIFVPYCLNIHKKRSPPQSWITYTTLAFTFLQYRSTFFFYVFNVILMPLSWRFRQACTATYCFLPVDIKLYLK